jgi:hypothetical protein
MKRRRCRPMNRRDLSVNDESASGAVQMTSRCHPSQAKERRLSPVRYLRPISRILIRVTATVIPVAFLAGCLPSLTEPERLYPASSETALIRDEIGVPDFKYFALLAGPQKVIYRNAIIDARMYAIDLNYFTYEANLTRERQEADFAAASSNIGLTAASVLVGPVQTKNILTGVAGSITGINQAYDDKVLLNKTMQVLQTQMRAERNRVATKIYKSMQLSAADYTLGMAMSDLEDYYRAGTVTGALIDVSNTVSDEANSAKAAKYSFTISHGFATDTLANTLQAYVYPKGMINPPDRTAYTNLTTLLAQLSPPVQDPLSRVLIEPGFAGVRQQLLAKARAAGFVK